MYFQLLRHVLLSIINTFMYQKSDEEYRYILLILVFSKKVSKLFFRFLFLVRVNVMLQKISKLGVNSFLSCFHCFFKARTFFGIFRVCTKNNMVYHA